MKNKILKILAITLLIFAFAIFAYKPATIEYCKNLTDGFTGIVGYTLFTSEPCRVKVGIDSHWVTWNEFLNNWLYTDNGTSNVDTSITDKAIPITGNNKMPPVVILFIGNNKAIRVAQQPLNDISYVTDRDNLLTQIWSDKLSSIGLVAHNYLAGKNFEGIKEGNQIVLVYDDETAQTFIVDNLKILPFTTEIEKVYNKSDTLILQTCIDEYNALIITAYPVK